MGYQINLIGDLIEATQNFKIDSQTGVSFVLLDDIRLQSKNCLFNQFNSQPQQRERLQLVFFYKQSHNNTVTHTHYNVLIFV